MQDSSLLFPAALMLLVTLGFIIGIFFIIKQVSFKYALFTAFILFTWVSDQAIQSFTGLYKDFTKLPPLLILFGIMPMLIGIIIMFSLKRSREVLSALSVAGITLLHFVRLPVEYMIYLLAAEEKMPVMMTFEGSNYDIIMGITALPMAVLVYKLGDKIKWPLVLWNILGLVLLFRVSYIGIFSAPFPFRKIMEGFPNTAVFEFPFALLPAFIVPMVLFAHLIALHRIFFVGQVLPKRLAEPVNENIID